MSTNDSVDFGARRAEQMKAERRARLDAEKTQLQGIVALYEQTIPQMEAALSGPHNPSLEEETKLGLVRMKAYVAKAKVRIGEIDAELARLG